MRTFKIKLIKKESIAFKTTSFYFSKPADLVFKSGNYGKFTLINPPKTDIKGDTRSFSFSSSPSEKELRISIRLRNSAYKKVLNSLEFGTELSLLAPIIMFPMPKNSSKPLVFLTGGIGVAVAKPMIKDILESNFDNDIYLFNSNRNSRDIPFLSDFQSLESQTKNFHYIPNVTKKDPEWTGEKGYLNPEMLKKYIPELSSAIYYLSGPPRFIWGMYKMLQELGIKQNQINFDEFTGY